MSRIRRIPLSLQVAVDGLEAVHDELDGWVLGRMEEVCRAQVIIALLVLGVECRGIDPQLAAGIAAADLQLALVGAEPPANRDQAEHAAGS